MELEMKARCRMTRTIERSRMNDLTLGPRVQRLLRKEHSG